MDNSKLLKLVIEQLNESVNDEDVVDAWNEICDDDDKIYPMSDFNEVCDVFNYDSPKEIIDRVRDDFDGFDLDAEWFYIDCGSYCSTDDPMDRVDEDRLAQHIIDGEVECGGIDVEELKKECCELRQFKNKEEFEQTTGLILGNVITIRNKELQHIERTGLIVEFRHSADNDRACNDCVCIGATFYNFDTLFTAWEYRQAGEWKPFGIANTEEKTTDAGSED